MGQIYKPSDSRISEVEVIDGVVYMFSKETCQEVFLTKDDLVEMLKLLGSSQMKYKHVSEVL